MLPPFYYLEVMFGLKHKHFTFCLFVLNLKSWLKFQIAFFLRSQHFFGCFQYKCFHVLH